MHYIVESRGIHAQRLSSYVVQQIKYFPTTVIYEKGIVINTFKNGINTNKDIVNGTPIIKLRLG